AANTAAQCSRTQGLKSGPHSQAIWRYKGNSGQILHIIIKVAAGIDNLEGLSVPIAKFEDICTCCRRENRLFAARSIIADGGNDRRGKFLIAFIGGFTAQAASEFHL